MKTLKNIFLVSLLAVFAVSCQDDDDRFNGSPDSGRLNIVTLDGIITTPAQSALTNQQIDWTVKLPRAFNDTVLVEATAINNTGRRLRANVLVMPGETEATEKITAPGGASFNTTFKLYLSGIALQTVDEGIHYLIKSDTLEIPTGNSSVPDQESDRLIVRLVWENPSAANNLALKVDRPDPIADAIVGGGNLREHKFTLGATGNNNNSLTTVQGDSYFSIKANALSTSPTDQAYRIIVVYPNGDTEVFSGVYQGLTLDSPYLDVLKVNKTINESNQTIFTVDYLIP